jgi:translation elongation factor EF-Tu-like GTPase
MDQVDDEELLQLIELRVRELLNKYEYDSHPPPLVPPPPPPTLATHQHKERRTWLHLGERVLYHVY